MLERGIFSAQAMNSPYHNSSRVATVRPVSALQVNTSESMSSLASEKLRSIINQANKLNGSVQKENRKIKQILGRFERSNKVVQV